MSLFSTLLPIIRSVFSRWTALQLAVGHSMGGPQSEEKYEAFIEAFGQYLIRNAGSSLSKSTWEQDIQEYLDETLDEEFNTILDDGSSNELAQLFVRYILLIQQGKLVDVQQELQLQQSATSATQLSIRNQNEDDSSSSSASDDNDDDNERDSEITGEKFINETRSQAMDVDEEGWITVHRRGGRKK